MESLVSRIRFAFYDFNRRILDDANPLGFVAKLGGNGWKLWLEESPTTGNVADAVAKEPGRSEYLSRSGCEHLKKTFAGHHWRTVARCLSICLRIASLVLDMLAEHVVVSWELSLLGFVEISRIHFGPRNL